MSHFLVNHIIASLRQMTGKRYPVLENELSNLSDNAQRDFNNLIRDLEYEIAKAGSHKGLFLRGPARPR